MRTRELLARNNELVAQCREAFDRNLEAFDRNLEAFDRNTAAFDRHAEAFANDRDVLRSLAAEIRAHTEKMERQGDATLGAMIDLAAEIRSWREEDGP